ncbi:hypothetical protein FA13DRAFT_1475135 [Coprinellus micaceus]|uniref:Uncharacterized protein n=1 Tax=Coprinellus micaceus TaxID=71717 RepID=A0A4Y7SLU5_COPMI|nr:hypothetical protein FA13DRAFT_1475135 [Coprinellus micaceus]
MTDAFILVSDVDGYPPLSRVRRRLAAGLELEARLGAGGPTGMYDPKPQAPSPTLTHPQMIRSASIIEGTRTSPTSRWQMQPVISSPTRGSPTPVFCPPPNRRFAAYLPLYDPAVQSVRRPTSCLPRSRSMSREPQQSAHAARMRLGSLLPVSPSTPRLASPSTSPSPAPCDLVRSPRRRPTSSTGLKRRQGSIPLR